jgi:murein L,D-transpeptidase YcbB/YkuD
MPAPAPAPTTGPDSPDGPVIPSQPVVPTGNGIPPVPNSATLPMLIAEPVMSWTAADAGALLQYIGSADREGLIPADYQPDALQAAIANGPGPALDEAASHAFDWLAEDLRDGRTPMSARQQWFAIDPDSDAMPTAQLLTKALATHDISGTLTALDPTIGEYTALKDALAAAPDSDQALRDVIRINMDRWRWLPHDLGMIYLIVNVPEFQVRLVSNHQIIRTYRTIVGKPGHTATPQLAEKVQAVVFNPTWTVPQSIIKGEGLGAKLLHRPRAGYKVTVGGDGTINVVQQPGPQNSLGLMKIDMPNPHAIYLHDTPSRALFNEPVRALSHGCIRTEKAVELGMIMAMLGAGMTPDEAIAKTNSRKYSRVAMTRTFPVYIMYSTFGRDTSGQLARFRDIYGRDAAVLASLATPRQLHTTQRTSNEPIIKAEDPL